MNQYTKKRVKRVSLILSIAVVGMFGFAYLLVPFYNVLCKQLGINGKPELVPVAQSKDQDVSRMLTMQFVTSTNANLPSFDFYTKTNSLQFHPGENKTVLFYVKNNTDHEITVQAIPSVTPGLAAQYVKKTECFCFTQQTLAAHEAKIMPLLFHIDKTIPNDINTLTLSYTLFTVKKKTQT
ncbi:MAG: cytochrome c oxidase assembly protein [Proteobacteria bacterium]|nr:cytochrome c oxidase assembly protein [Pseudomonadota bacterium]